jgi:hypothetical protein
MQRPGKNVTAATNAHATVEEFLEASSSMRSVSYERKAGYQFFPEILVLVLISILLRNLKLIPPPSLPVSLRLEGRMITRGDGCVTDMMSIFANSLLPHTGIDFQSSNVYLSEPYQLQT